MAEEFSGFKNDIISIYSRIKLTILVSLAGSSAGLADFGLELDSLSLSYAFDYKKIESTRTSTSIIPAEVRSCLGDVRELHNQYTSA